MKTRRGPILAAAALLVLGSAAVFVEMPAASAAGAAKPAQTGLHVSGSSILNGAGQPVQLHGVNFSGFEYGCVDPDEPYMNDGDVPPNMKEVNGLLSWNVNTVRIPLNEDCWLGDNDAVPAAYRGTAYQNAVANFVNLLTGNNISVILNLHFNGDGTSLAVEQEPMADATHSLDFWTGVAGRFKANSSVLFELYNEPHLNTELPTAAAAWACWRDGGCTVAGQQDGDGEFTVAGMQAMLNRVRGTGATNIVIATGEDWGSDLSGWLQYKPSDPAGQLVAGWHQYHDGLSCQSSSCWDSTLAAVLTAAPILTTEVGQIDQGCNTKYVDPVLNWLDSHNQQGYYAWTWGPFDCQADPALVTDWYGTPTRTYGSNYKAHLLTRP
jgi:hypothetical protein